MSVLAVFSKLYLRVDALLIRLLALLELLQQKFLLLQQHLDLLLALGNLRLVLSSLLSELLDRRLLASKVRLDIAEVGYQPMVGSQILILTISTR